MRAYTTFEIPSDLYYSISLILDACPHSPAVLAFTTLAQEIAEPEPESESVASQAWEAYKLKSWASSKSLLPVNLTLDEILLRHLVHAHYIHVKQYLVKTCNRKLASHPFDV